MNLFAFAGGASSRQKASFRQISAACSKAVVCFALGFISLCADGQTPVSGTISTNTRWTASGGPYLLSGEVTVEGGAALTIEAGAIVYMAAGAGFTVQTGTLQAIGTSERPIAILSDKTRLGQTAAPGDWNRLTIGPAAANTKLEHLLLEHGRGLKVRGSAAVMNHVEIRNHLGPAIDADLAAALSGIGNKASGNTTNAVVVPAGEITGTATWALRGIPYLVDAGVVSVGTSPRISAVTPNTVQQGETVTISVTGQRLDGFLSATLDNTGLVLTPFDGASSSQINFQLKANASAAVGPTSLRLAVNAGEIVLPNAVSVTPPLPVVSAINPATIVAGAGAAQVTVTGRNFTTQSIVTVNSAELATQYVSATELRVTIPNQSQAGTQMLAVKMSDPANAGRYLTSNEVALTVQVPVPPTLTIEPTPIAIPPDGRSHEIIIRLSKADYQDITLNFSAADPSRATVSPVGITIPAGQTSARVSIVPGTAGVTTLYVDSARIQRVSVPLFITADFRGASTSYALPVGVLVEGGNAAPQSVSTIVAGSVVGLAVGPVLTGVEPGGLAAGVTRSFTLTGIGLTAGTQAQVVPNTGITVGAPTVSPDGTQIVLPLTAADNAAAGARRLVVSDATGKAIPFADPARGFVTVTTGLPGIDSMTPLYVAAGNILRLTVRGRNLQGGKIQVLPDSDLQIDNQLQVTADGTSLVANIMVAAGASKGPRVVRIVTAAGDSGSVATSANTFDIVSQVKQDVTPIASPLVGVVVGQDTTQPSQSVSYGPVVAPQVEVLVGAAIRDIAPRVGVVGNEVTVVVSGQGLGSVTGSAILPAAGLTVGTPAITPDGTQVSFTVRIDAGAALGLRRIALSTATGPVTLAQGVSAGFLVAAPVPEVSTVAPQVIQAGKPAVLVTLRGRNFSNVSGVRLDPPQGMAVTGPYTASPDGTSLTFNLAADASAASGRRTVIVVAAGGESSADQQPGNSLMVGRDIGPIYANLLSPQVGVLVGAETVPPVNQDTILLAPLVGVLVDGSPAANSTNMLANAPAVSVVVGTAARAMTPAGWLQGASGDIVITGSGLDQITSVAALPAEGILLGAPLVNANGTELTVPISVAPNASTTGSRRLRLITATGAATFIDSGQALFGIGVLPTMNSVSPISLEKGKQASLTVRGTNLKGVIRAHFEPGDGITVVGVPSWSQDALGELLTMPVTVDASAATGARVLRLEVPGGVTQAEASPANSISIVPPQ